MSSRPEQPSPSPTPSRFTLAGLFELIAGVALYLGLITQLGCFGVFLGLVAMTILLLIDHLVVPRDEEETLRAVGLFSLVWASLVTVGLNLLAAIRMGEFESTSTRRTEDRGGVSQAALLILISLTALFLLLAIVRRVRLAQRKRASHEQ